jgi:hypothetical protein
LEAENGKVTFLHWVVILLRILSEALIILLFTSPEVIRGFYRLELRVDLPVLHGDDGYGDDGDGDDSDGDGVGDGHHIARST